jgi:hypothetical protein
MHRSLPSSAKLAWAPSVSSSTSTYCSEASAPPRIPGQGSNHRPEDLHGMQCKVQVM